MFGDYFQHDAHELLRCLLMHIDDAITGLRQFCSSALPATTYFRLKSPATHRDVSGSFSQTAELSRDTSCSPDMLSTSSSPVRRTVKLWPRGAKTRPHQSVSRHWHSLPSSPCASLVVDLCMPRKYKSLGASPHSSQQQLSAAVVSAESLCDRLKQKRKSPWSSLMYRQRVQTKCKNFDFYCYFSRLIDDLGKNYEPAMFDCLRDNFYTHCNQRCQLSNELLMRGSEDHYPEDCILTQLGDDTEVACGTLDGLTDGCVDAPVADSHCSLEAFPQASGYTSLSVKDQLLLSLHAVESARSCYISLCCENRRGLSAQAASRRDCTVKDTTTSMKTGSVRRHVACVGDMFGGQMLTETKCLSCGFVARHSELYEDIALFAGHCARRRTCHTLLLLFSFLITVL